MFLLAIGAEQRPGSKRVSLNLSVMRITGTRFWHGWPNCNAAQKAENVEADNEILTTLEQSIWQHKTACRNYDPARLFSENIGQPALEGM
jgi:hypothetical protein